MGHAGITRYKPLVFLFAPAGLASGLALHVAGPSGIAGTIWMAGVVPVPAALIVGILRSLRRGEVGLDIVAALPMSAALTLGEILAAAVVVVT